MSRVESLPRVAGRYRVSDTAEYEGRALEVVVHPIGVDFIVGVPRDLDVSDAMEDYKALLRAVLGDRWGVRQAWWDEAGGVCCDCWPAGAELCDEVSEADRVVWDHWEARERYIERDPRPRGWRRRCSRRIRRAA